MGHANGRWRLLVVELAARLPGRHAEQNGQELFYLAADGGLMRVPVTLASEWAAGAPARVLDGRYYRGFGNVPRGYDVSLDGKRFSMIKPAGLDQSAPPPSIVVVQNWFEELKRLVPPKR